MFANMGQKLENLFPKRVFVLYHEEEVMELPSGLIRLAHNGKSKLANLRKVMKRYKEVQFSKDMDSSGVKTVLKNKFDMLHTDRLVCVI